MGTAKKHAAQQAFASGLVGQEAQRNDFIVCVSLDGVIMAMTLSLCRIAVAQMFLYLNKQATAATP
jgi:hypothetical protein